MPSAQRWSAHLEAAGCDVLEVRELSQLMRPRSESETSQAIEVGASAQAPRHLLGLRRIGEAEIGGLLLEKLIANASCLTD